MTWFHNRRIAGKLATAFLVVIGLGAAVSGVAIIRLAAVRTQVDGLTTQALPELASVAGLTDRVGEVRRQLLSYLAASSPDERDVTGRALDTESAALNTQLASFAGATTRADVQPLARELSTRWASYARAQDDVLKLARDPARTTELAVAQSSATPLFDQVRDTLGRLAARVSADGEDSSAQIRGLVSSVRLWVLGFALLAVLIGIAIALAVSRALVVPVRQIEAAASAMASGELNAEVHYQGSD